MDPKSKNKILLVTLQGANLGNRLQNYALQTVLQDLGFEVFTPYYDIPEENTRKKRIVRTVKTKLGLKRYQGFEHHYLRKKRFAEFDRRYITNRFKVHFDRPDRSVAESYDFAITGSDQVWHRWSDSPGELEYFYLQFMPPEKRISYAASFGFQSFPEADLDVHRAGLTGMRALSCREQRGAELIQELTGREAKITADPTLLLPVDRWRKVSREAKIYSGKPFVLLYFLGDKAEQFDSIRKLAEAQNLEIIDALDRASLPSMLTTPDEFLWLVEHAEFVCTDSFHACVFSILFQKRFLAFRRKEEGFEHMFDRIEDLLKTFRLEDRIFSGKLEAVLQEPDYSKTEKIRAEAAEESMAYLREALQL